MDKTTFEQSIYRNWATHFGQAAEITSRPGTTLIREEKYRGDKDVALWFIGKHTFAQFDPDLTDMIQGALAQFPADQSLTADALAAILGPKQIASRDRGRMLYLHPDALPAYAPPAPYIVRPLTLADAGALLALKGFMTAEEVDEGYVEVNHQIAFGCFDGKKLVAAASGYELAGFMDIGVLTHSAFRRRGLGKAVVGALCAWAIQNGYIAQYRHDLTNINSANVAQSLNFSQFGEEETLRMK
jgi:GNAT superfamily N-acetyltransferase